MMYMYLPFLALFFPAFLDLLVVGASAQHDGREHRIRIRSRPKRQRRRAPRRLASTGNRSSARRTSSIQTEDAPAKKKSELHLTLSNENAVESAIEEDHKFATEVVAAHQVDAVEEPTSKTKKNKDALEKNDNKRTHKYSHMKGPFSCFRTVSGTMDTMHDIAARYPHLATIVDIGQSYLGFDSKVLVLTGTSSGKNTKGKIFLTFGLHARELAPPELGTRWAEHLTRSYSIDADVTQVLDYNEIHLLLQANPDGRQKAEKKPSRGKDNGWRKNAHDYPSDQNDGGTGCSDDSVYGTASSNGNGTTYVYGVDLNRNFPYMWGGNGSSSNPCADNYRGPSPYHPEPEVAAIIDYAKSLFPSEQRQNNADSMLTKAYDEDTAGVYIDVHASGKIVGMPWYYKNITAPNIWELMALNHKFCSFNGHKPVVSGYDSFWYEAAGATDDYMYGSLGAAAFTFEVGHDQAENCNYFEKEIVPYNFHALLFGAKVSRAPYRIPQGPDITRLVLSRSLEDPNNALRVEIEASDVHRTLVKDKRGVRIPDRYPAIPSGQQDIAEIQVFVDDHPYNDSKPLPYTSIQIEAFDSPTEGATIDIDTSSLLEGQHTVCIRTIDAADYAGAVSCAYFNIDASHRFSKQCVDSDGYFSLQKDVGSWADRAKTCLDTAEDAEAICGRRVKYSGSTLVKDICPLRCDTECTNNR